MKPFDDEQRRFINDAIDFRLNRNPEARPGLVLLKLQLGLCEKPVTQEVLDWATVHIENSV